MPLLITTFPPRRDVTFGSTNRHYLLKAFG